MSSGANWAEITDLLSNIAFASNAGDWTPQQAKSLLRQRGKCAQIVVIAAVKSIVIVSGKASLINATRTELTALARGNRFGKSVATLCCASDGPQDELTVTNNMIASVDKNELLGTSTRRGIESSTCALRTFAAKVYGGGSEYFSFWQSPLWPFNWIRLFAQEEE